MKNFNVSKWSFLRMLSFSLLAGGWFNPTFGSEGLDGAFDCPSGHRPPDAGAYVLIGADSGGDLAEFWVEGQMKCAYSKVLVDDRFRQARDMKVHYPTPAEVGEFVGIEDIAAYRLRNIAEYHWLYRHVFDRQNAEALASQRLKRNELQKDLERLLESHRSVDVFVLAHDNDHYSALENLPVELRRKIRLVYNSGCKDLEDAPKWLELGAKVYLGSPGLSCSPIFFSSFLENWLQGKTLQQAIDAGNGNLTRNLPPEDEGVPTLAGALCAAFGESHSLSILEILSGSTVRAERAAGTPPLERITIRSHPSAARPKGGSP